MDFKFCDFSQDPRKKFHERNSRRNYIRKKFTLRKTSQVQSCGCHSFLLPLSLKSKTMKREANRSEIKNWFAGKDRYKMSKKICGVGGGEGEKRNRLQSIPRVQS